MREPRSFPELIRHLRGRIRHEQHALDDFEEALKLLDLIDAEFQSDPMSVQCFDLRIVKRVHDLVTRYRRSPGG